MKFMELLVEMPTHARHPMQEFCRQSPAMGRVHLLAWNVTSDDAEYALFRIEGDAEAYRERIERVNSVIRFNLTAIDEESFYNYVVQEPRAAEQRWREAFLRRDLVVVPPIVYDEDGRMVITVVGNRDDLGALIEDFPEGFSITVRGVGEYDRRHPAIATEELTDRQLDAIEAAVEVGYYEVPRQAGLAAVAEKLGCAESTASNHLRKAEGRVIRRLVGAAGWEPA